MREDEKRVKSELTQRFTEFYHEKKKVYMVLRNLENLTLLDIFTQVSSTEKVLSEEL